MNSQRVLRRAIRLVRSRAREWNIKPDRIGVLGFSAGGELAALAAMQSDSGNPDAAEVIDQMSCRPRLSPLEQKTATTSRWEWLSCT